MARLIYTAITSLDSYVADEDGNFGRSAPDEEMHTSLDERRFGNGVVHLHYRTRR